MRLRGAPRYELETPTGLGLSSDLNSEAGHSLSSLPQPAS